MDQKDYVDLLLSQTSDDDLGVVISGEKKIAVACDDIETRAAKLCHRLETVALSQISVIKVEESQSTTNSSVQI